ncbi:polysaccharide pyruvyl transferase family protein [Paracraurococcus lichenis]|uniref:Polysaccharide pyruvyl transferase family protein n=1 Tax=Paracraurococcus lichenis TaxID=3064888 RepID=A0ABT9DUI7_9PROT|nr:polysaccharide pyruvyl transferase family protein [Paracraurococcus sp. LOR1-02]MDO9707548.1 polysaccharide pyruvyl transferase family protein [Paracraurococcus sp. LOR1-02]
MTLSLRPVGLDLIASAIRPEDARLAVPDHLQAAAAARWPERQVIPTHALRADAPPDLVMLHTGLLRRVARPALRALLDACRPVLATEDALLLRPALCVAEAALRPDWLAEVARLRRAAAPPEAGALDLGGTALVAADYGSGDIGAEAAAMVAGRIAAAAGFRRVILAGAAAAFDLAREADLVVLAGGGAADPAAVADQAGLLRHAQDLGRRSVALGLGLRGRPAPEAAATWREALGRADHVAVCDPFDLGLVREELGIGQAVLAADPCFGLGTFVWPPGPLPPRRLALVAPGAAGEEAAWEGVIRHLAEAQEVVIARHAPGDAALCERLARATGARLEVMAERGVVGTGALYREAATVVAGRSHALVCGLLAGCRLLPVVPPEGRQARLVRWALPSLAAAVTPPERFLAEPPAVLLAAAVAADPSEVAALQGRVQDLPVQIAAALRGPVGIQTTMAAIRAALAAAPEMTAIAA